LPHEQGHHDIPCVLVHKANAARASGAAVTLAAVRARANTLTAQYDALAQSNHGCNAAGQATWDSDIALGLPGQNFP
jgi:cytochrome c1